MDLASIPQPEEREADSINHKGGSKVNKTIEVKPEDELATLNALFGGD